MIQQKKLRRPNTSMFPTIEYRVATRLLVRMYCQAAMALKVLLYTIFGEHNANHKQLLETIHKFICLVTWSMVLLQAQANSQGPRVPKTGSRENHLPKAIFWFECYH